MLTKLRVLLIDCGYPFRTIDSPNWERIHNLHLPVGLLTLKSYIAKSFIAESVQIDVWKSISDYSSYEELEQKISEHSPDVVGLRCTNWHTTQFHHILKFCKNLNTRIITIAGGPYASVFPDQLMKSEPALDYAVSGEGEEVFLDFLKMILEKAPPSNIPGLHYRDDSGTVNYTGCRVLSPNVDALGFPNWREVNFTPYLKNHGLPFTPRKMADVTTSRGCPYRCTYCHDIFQKSFRTRSAENILEEFKMLQDIGVTDISIFDDIFNLDNNRVINLFNLLAQHHIKFRFHFPNGLRGDRMPNELIDAMVEGGCISFGYALETASERLQKLLKKNMQLDRLKNAIEYTIRKGVIVDVFIMAGIPYETHEEMYETLKFVEEFKGMRFPILNILHAFPGTAINKEIESLQGTDPLTNLDFSKFTEQTHKYLGHDRREQIRKFRMDMFTRCILDYEKLTTAIETQRKFFTDAEILFRYQSYFANNTTIKSLDSLLQMSKGLS